MTDKNVEPEKRGPGRPPTQWDEKKAKKVQKLAGRGMPVDLIAVSIDVSDKTLKKVYGEDVIKGKARVGAKVLGLIVDIAVKKQNVPLLMFIAKTQYGWSENITIDHTSSDESMRPTIVDLSGKSKEEMREIFGMAWSQNAAQDGTVPEEV